MKKYRFTGLLLLAGFIVPTLASCEKEEAPVTLPPAGPAVKAEVSMGGDYKNQIFYDFETQKVVKTSEVASWDLAFESGPTGTHLFMNGGKNVYVFNTHESDFNGPFAVPATTDLWQFDAPNGSPDSTGIGEWRDLSTGQSKNEVYLVRLSETEIYKMQILSADQGKYRIHYGAVQDNVPHVFEIPKNYEYNFSYFSFGQNGHLVMPDPPKEAWDIVFTRYRYIYRELKNFPYEVNGVLLNPYKTTAAKDSVTQFYDISKTTAANLPFSAARDVIGGFGWKTYNFSTSRYEVNSAMNYVIRNRNGKWYKLHFLDFYSTAGEKGCPSFEFRELE